MREIFQLPALSESDITSVEACLKALQTLFEANAELDAFTLEEDDTALLFKDEQVQAKAAGLRDKISALTKKSYTLCRLKSFISEVTDAQLHKRAITLVLPKAPAVFDMTHEEVVQLLEVIKANVMQDAAGIYYLELLKNSLLLADVEAYIFDPVAHGLLKESTLAEVAKKIIDDGNDISEILVF